MSLQRSLQNGFQREASDHSTGRLHVGQVTTGILATAYSLVATDFPQVQVVSKNFTSFVVCTGRALTSVHVMKRMLHR